MRTRSGVTRSGRNAYQTSCTFAYELHTHTGAILLVDSNLVPHVFSPGQPGTFDHDVRSETGSKEVISAEEEAVVVERWTVPFNLHVSV